MDSDDVGGTVLAIVVVVAIFVGLFWFIGIRRDGVDADCKERYGSSWVGKTPAYSPDFCVDKDGSVKYLQ